MPMKIAIGILRAAKSKSEWYAGSTEPACAAAAAKYSDSRQAIWRVNTAPAEWPKR